MNEHDVQTIAFAVITVIGIIATVRKQFRAQRRPAPRSAPVAPLVTGPAASPVAVRRRLAPPQAVRPVMPPVVPARSPVFAPAADLAAAAFPQLDLTLPGYEGTPGTAQPRRRFRSPGGGPAIGSPAWAANAVVAAEIMGPPVSLRPGATLGAPHAF